VTFDYEDGATAQKVVERLASFFIDTNARERGSQAEQTSSFLEAQMADARTRLEAQEQKLKDFRERNAGRLPTQMQANMQAIQSAQMALQAAIESVARDRDRKLILERLYNEAVAEAEAEGSASGSGSTSGDPAANIPANAPPEQRLEAARRALTQMEIRLSEKHPDVGRLKRLIADLERQVEAGALQRPVNPEGMDAPPVATPDQTRKRDKLREQRAELESLERQINFKANEERRLRAEIAGYQRRLEAVPGVESEWVALTRDYDTLQASYRELLAKSENSKMAASLEQRQIGEQFRILDPPRVPQKPFSPNRPRINMMGAAAGLGIGLALLGLAWFSDSTMRSEADVLGAIDLPVMALLPYVPSEQDRRVWRRRRWLEATAVIVLMVAVGSLFWFLRLWKFLV
jgi:polysaccharide chain length determinant protein (PEP-CTERM system associated)